MRRTPLIVAVAPLALIVAGWPVDRPSGIAASVTAAPTAVTSEPPSSATLRQVLDQAIGWLNGEPVDEQQYGELFAPTFVEQLPYATFTQLLEQLRASGPWMLDGEPVEPAPGVLVAPLVDGGGQRFSLEIVLADTTTPIIDGLLIEPAADPPASVEEALATLRSAGTMRLLTAEVSDGDCTPITDIDGDDAMPLGSVFKLYVLGAVAEAIDGGALTWESAVTIRDELDSIPSGTTQDEPPGSELSVLELATRMISVSDNTATDHLIDLVGRQAVEDALTTYGHAEPTITLPFLTTRELTIIKFSGGDLAERYAAASLDERRALLAGEVASAPLPPVSNVITAAPTAIDTIEWFASPADLCRALLGLSRYPEVLEILAINPGVPAEPGGWSYVGFKGGSEPGVLALAWLVEDAAGRRFVVVGGVANEEAAIPETVAVEALVYLRDAVGADADATPSTT